MVIIYNYRDYNVCSVVYRVVCITILFHCSTIHVLVNHSVRTTSLASEMTSQRWSAHFTEPLTHLPSLPSSRTPIILQTNADAAEQTFTKQKLRSLLVALDGSQSRQDYADAVSVLTELEHDSFAAVQTVDEEAETLERAVMTKLIVSLYSDSLDTYLTQSLQIEEEAEWWASIERSASNVAWYLLQSGSTFNSSDCKD